MSLFPSTEFEGRDDEVKEGNYFIVDMLGINPNRPSMLMPRIVVHNATEEDLKNIEAGKIKIPDPMIGCKQRVILKAERIRTIGEKKIPKG